LGLERFSIKQQLLKLLSLESEIKEGEPEKIISESICAAEVGAGGKKKRSFLF
jgi:hypothetical protein